MKYSLVFLTSAATLATARTNIFDFDSMLRARSNPSLIYKREVPQEHSHEAILRLTAQALNLNNPDGIVDPVFGLLGDAAASQGKGKIADVACLQTATADQAFTNAKAKKDVNLMVASLTYRALERNTGKVGLASAACTSFKPKNAEISALSQHQDPASSGAAGINKSITLELAKQIASVGGDPNKAIESGTFAPGDVNDNTGKGNTCDDANDEQGCIFTQDLLVPDVTLDEISAAIKGGAGGNAGGNAQNQQQRQGNQAAAAAANQQQNQQQRQSNQAEAAANQQQNDQAEADANQQRQGNQAAVAAANDNQQQDNEIEANAGQQQDNSEIQNNSGMQNGGMANQGMANGNQKNKGKANAKGQAKGKGKSKGKAKGKGKNKAKGGKNAMQKAGKGKGQQGMKADGNQNQSNGSMQGEQANRMARNQNGMGQEKQQNNRMQQQQQQNMDGKGSMQNVNRNQMGMQQHNGGSKGSQQQQDAEGNSDEVAQRLGEATKKMSGI